MQYCIAPIITVFNENLILLIIQTKAYTVDAFTRCICIETFQGSFSYLVMLGKKYKLYIACTILLFDKRISCLTVYNAFCNPRKTPKPVYTSSTVCLVLSVRLLRAWTVKSFGVKPICKR